MKKDTFKITKMDCPSEEQLIRMKLEPHSGVARLEFDIPDRKLTVFHTGDTEFLVSSIAELNLNSSLISSEDVNGIDSQADDASDKKLLWIVFAINAGFFLIEIVAGLIANSMGLVADSLDMLADAIVYGMSLMVVGSTIIRKKRIAKLSGYFQLALAVFGLAEVIRRFLGIEEAPNYLTMVLVSLFALIGNAISLYLLQKKKSKEAHMEASYIFTSNDVIANIGVILAGVIVYFTKSFYPDLIIGSIVFLLVARGAVRILKLSK
jgi:Co/Zn/Cd efflux system component